MASTPQDLAASILQQEEDFEGQLGQLYDAWLGPAGRSLALHHVSLAKLLAAVPALVRASQALQNAMTAGGERHLSTGPDGQEALEVVPTADVLANLFTSDAGGLYLRLMFAYAKLFVPAWYALCDLPPALLHVGTSHPDPDASPVTTATRLLAAPLVRLHRLDGAFRRGMKRCGSDARQRVVLSNQSDAVSAASSAVLRVFADARMKELYSRISTLAPALPESSRRFVVAEGDFAVQGGPFATGGDAAVVRVVLLNDALLVTTPPPAPVSARNTIFAPLRECHLGIDQKTGEMTLSSRGRRQFMMLCKPLPGVSLKHWAADATKAGFGSHTVRDAFTTFAQQLRAVANTPMSTPMADVSVALSGDALRFAMLHMCAPVAAAVTDKVLPTSVFDEAPFVTDELLLSTWAGLLTHAARLSALLTTSLSMKVKSGFRRKYVPVIGVLQVTAMHDDLSTEAAMLVYDSDADLKASTAPKLTIDINQIRGVSQDRKRFSLRAGKNAHKFDCATEVDTQRWVLTLACLRELVSRLTQTSHTVARELSANPDFKLKDHTARQSFRVSGARQSTVVALVAGPVLQSVAEAAAPGAGAGAATLPPARSRVFSSDSLADVLSGHGSVGDGLSVDVGSVDLGSASNNDSDDESRDGHHHDGGDTADSAPPSPAVDGDADAAADAAAGTDAADAGADDGNAEHLDGVSAPEADADASGAATPVDVDGADGADGGAADVSSSNGAPMSAAAKASPLLPAVAAPQSPQPSPAASASHAPAAGPPPLSLASASPPRPQLATDGPSDVAPPGNHREGFYHDSAEPTASVVGRAKVALDGASCNGNSGAASGMPLAVSPIVAAPNHAATRPHDPGMPSGAAAAPELPAGGFTQEATVWATSVSHLRRTSSLLKATWARAGAASPSTAAPPSGPSSGAAGGSAVPSLRRRGRLGVVPFRHPLPAVPPVADKPVALPDVLLALEAPAAEARWAIDELQQALEDAIDELDTAAGSPPFAHFVQSTDDLRAKVAEATAARDTARTNVVAFETTWCERYNMVYHRSLLAMKLSIQERGHQEALAYSHLLRRLKRTSRRLTDIIERRKDLAATLRRAQRGLEQKFGMVSDVVDGMMKKQNADLALLSDKTAAFEDHTRSTATVSARDANDAVAEHALALAAVGERQVLQCREEVAATVATMRARAANDVKRFAANMWSQLSAAGHDRLAAIRARMQEPVATAQRLLARITALDDAIARRRRLSAQAAVLGHMKRAVREEWAASDTPAAQRGAVMAGALAAAPYSPDGLARLSKLRTVLVEAVVRRRLPSAHAAVDAAIQRPSVADPPSPPASADGVVPFTPQPPHSQQPASEPRHRLQPDGEDRTSSDAYDLAEAIRALSPLHRGSVGVLPAVPPPPGSATVDQVAP